MHRQHAESAHADRFCQSVASATADSVNLESGRKDPRLAHASKRRNYATIRGNKRVAQTASETPCS